MKYLKGRKKETEKERERRRKGGSQGRNQEDPTRLWYKIRSCGPDTKGKHKLWVVWALEVGTSDWELDPCGTRSSKCE